MKLKLHVIVLFFAVIGNVFAQEKIKGNKIVTAVETELHGFDKVYIGEKFDITLSESTTPSIYIETDENLHDVIAFSVTDSVFSISTTAKITSSKKMNIRLNIPSNLKELILSEDAKVESLSTIRSENFTLRIQDFGVANLSIKCDTFKLVNQNRSRIQLKSKTELQVESTSATIDLGESSKTEAIIKTDHLDVKLIEKATLNLEGSSDSFYIQAIETTNLKAESFIAKSGDVEMTDKADISVQITEDINIAASGSSELNLYGYPAISISKFAESAKLSKKEL